MLIKIIFVVTILILNSTSISAKGKPALICLKVMPLEPAQKLAKAALNDYREWEPQIAVSVVNPLDNLQTTVRGGYDGSHILETVQPKAWPAIRFCSDTFTLVAEKNSGTAASSVWFIPEAPLLGGDVPVQSRSPIFRAIGVLSTPDTLPIDEYLRVDIDRIAGVLEF